MKENTLIAMENYSSAVTQALMKLGIIQYPVEYDALIQTDRDLHDALMNEAITK